MKRALFFLPLIALSMSGLADDALPKRPDFARYAPMLKRSPFAVATAVAAPAATPDFAKDLYLASAAKLPDGDETVTIASVTDKNFKRYPTRSKPDDGWAISNIEWSDKPGQTRATLTKDGKFATLSFNQALLSQTTQATGPASQPGIPLQPPQFQPQAPGMPQIPRPYQQPVPVPDANGNRRVRPMIPRNPGVQPTPILAPTAAEQ
ncbi:MAG: hypothetical protein M3R59_01520 [Verrucomicrobiota bacterium]|nr:hypothetical protein [Verrucomicrobiota bacterium]